MASKKKVPSFDIPEAVRDAAQSGWVYRTEEDPVRPRAGRRSAHRPSPSGTEQPKVAPEGAQAPPLPPPPSEPIPATPADIGITGGIIGLGLQVAAVPLVVPLFLTAAVARRLGITNEP